MGRLTSQEVGGLMEAYNSIYSPQTEITEEQIWEEVEEWVNFLLDEGYDLSEYTWEDMYESYLYEGGPGPRAKAVEKQGPPLPPRFGGETPLMSYVPATGRTHNPTSSTQVDGGVLAPLTRGGKRTMGTCNPDGKGGCAPHTWAPYTVRSVIGATGGSLSSPRLRRVIGAEIAANTARYNQFASRNIPVGRVDPFAPAGNNGRSGRTPAVQRAVGQQDSQRSRPTVGARGARPATRSVAPPPPPSTQKDIGAPPPPTPARPESDIGAAIRRSQERQAADAARVKPTSPASSTTGMRTRSQVFGSSL